MSELTRQIVLAERRRRRHALSREERAARRKMRKEARAAGADLDTGFGANVSPSQALGAYRRDSWRCKECGRKEQLGLKGRDSSPSQLASLVRRARGQDQKSLVVVCRACHDGALEQSRAGGEE